MVLEIYFPVPVRKTPLAVQLKSGETFAVHGGVLNLADIYPGLPGARCREYQS